MKLLYTPQFVGQLDKLGKILFEKNYFSYEENAQDYIISIYKNIKKNIAVKRIRKSPAKAKKYGDFFITMRLTSGSRTTWYIFFDIMEDVYKINHIENNHVKISSILGGK